MTGPVASEAGGPPAVDSVTRILALLSEALRIVDEEQLPKEIGARLNEVIVAVRETQTSG